MREPNAVADALSASFANSASGDVSTFAEVVTREEAALAIGSAAHEWFAGQEAARGAYGPRGVLIQPGQSRPGIATLSQGGMQPTGVTVSSEPGASGAPSFHAR